MDELIQCLNTAIDDNVKLFFVTRKKNQNTKVITYNVLTSGIQPAVAHDLRINGYDQISKIQSHDHEIISYGILSQSDRYTVETVNFQSVPFLKEILEGIAQPADGNRISDDKYSQVWGYIVRIENSDNTTFLFRKYTPKKLLEKGKVSCLIGRFGQFEKLNGQAIAFDSHYDAALLIESQVPEAPEQLRNLLIFSRGSFESFFSFIDEYRREIENNLNDLTKKQIMEDVSQIVETCSEDSRTIKKLAKILTTQTFNSLTPKNIEKTIRDYDLPVTLNSEGKIQVVKEHIWIILRILDDDYVESKATRNKYESRSKVKK